MKLYGDKIAVTPIIETQTKGGLALPQGSRKSRAEVLRGKIAAVGTDAYAQLTKNEDVPMVHDKIVHYFAGAVFEVTIDDTLYHIIDMSTLLCMED